MHLGEWTESTCGQLWGFLSHSQEFAWTAAGCPMDLRGHSLLSDLQRGGCAWTVKGQVSSMTLLLGGCQLALQMATIPVRVDREFRCNIIMNLNRF